MTGRCKSCGGVTLLRMILVVLAVVAIATSVAVADAAVAVAVLRTGCWWQLLSFLLASCSSVSVRRARTSRGYIHAMRCTRDTCSAPSPTSLRSSTSRTRTSSSSATSPCLCTLCSRWASCHTPSSPVSRWDCVALSSSPCPLLVPLASCPTLVRAAVKTCAAPSRYNAYHTSPVSRQRCLP